MGAEGTKTCHGRDLGGHGAVHSMTPDLEWNPMTHRISVERMPAILTAQKLEKSFGTLRVLDQVSFAVAEWDRVGLVGLNGAGKSTLLRLLVGGSEDPNDQPDGGLITRQRGLTIEYVPQ